MNYNQTRQVIELNVKDRYRIKVLTKEDWDKKLIIITNRSKSGCYLVSDFWLNLGIDNFYGGKTKRNILYIYK